MSAPIVPAVIPSSAAEVVAHAERLQFSPEFHLDIVDGQFVPTVSWPIEPAGDPLEVRAVLDAFTLEVDLMVSNPLPLAEAWVVAGADMLVFHAETLSLAQFRSFAEYSDASVGISINGATPLATLLEYAAVADYVQLMGIYDIGAQGQPLDESLFEKIAAVKIEYPSLPISVDGSVNAATIERMYDAGADRFICGSAITLQADPAAAHAALSALIN